MKVGPGNEEGVVQGPLINEAGLKKVEAHVADALAKGAQALTGGKRHALGHTFFEPTVLINATADMRLAAEETFGPVAPLFRFKDEEEAIASQTARPMGLPPTSIPATSPASGALRRSWSSALSV